MRDNLRSSDSAREYLDVNKEMIPKIVDDPERIVTSNQVLKNGNFSFWEFFSLFSISRIFIDENYFFSFSNLFSSDLASIINVGVATPIIKADIPILHLLDEMIDLKVEKLFFK